MNHGIYFNRYLKCIKLECESNEQCLDATLTVLLKNQFILITGSRGEGTNITSGDYGKCLDSTTPHYVSDIDVMEVMCTVQVTDEGDTLPERFGNNIYIQAERGEHTTDGFRKLRIIHEPEFYSPREEERAHIINKSVERGYISSSIFLAKTASVAGTSPMHPSVLTGLGTQGPSDIRELGGEVQDLVRCFYVKTWPKEAESWLTRTIQWPGTQLKSKIRNIGYLLVPTGNSNSQESDLEWRCSFSIAEKILFQSMTTVQKSTFVILKVLLKMFLPADVNTDGEKQLLSTYHIKTVFLWSLEDSNVKWEPENMLDIIDHLLEELSGWINDQDFPHYFIPSVNLLDSSRLDGRGKALICFISAIRKDLSNKMKQSQFFMGHELKHYSVFESGVDFASWSILQSIHQCVMHLISGRAQKRMHNEVFINIEVMCFSHSLLIEGLTSIELHSDPQMQHLYRAMYTDPIHDKLLREVVPGLIDQYRGCMHLAKYCMAVRDGRVLPDVLHKAESLLKDTLHLDPCSGYVKLACLYIATGDYGQAMDYLNVAENNFLHMYRRLPIDTQRNLVADKLSSSTTVLIREIFQTWVEGQVTSDIVVTWQEYITLPDLLQFELIHESIQRVGGVPYEDKQVKMVGLSCLLQWPPLSVIKLLKFVCAFNSGQFSTRHMENLAVDVIASSLSLCVSVVNDIYTVFNMAAWCYVKMKRYKPAIRIMMVSIESNLETKTLQKIAFSHHFLAYVIAQCLL